MNKSRREFVRDVLLGSSALLLAPGALRAQKKPRADPYDQKLIKEFVVAGHNDLDKVKMMLADDPNLLNCTWDWGGGDFEMAIGGAGHLGNKEIANYLISVGARVDLFVLTMLGKTNIVKPVLEEYPNLIFAKGPHGFTMLHHAKQGGENALKLYEYLQSKGLDKTKVTLAG